MAAGRSVVRGAAHGADVASTAASLARLGLDVPAGPVPPAAVRRGGWDGRCAREADLNAGQLGDNDAAPDRGPGGPSRPLRALGGRVALVTPHGAGGVAATADGCLGVACQGGPAADPGGGTPLHGIAYDIPIASAQVKGAVLLAGLQAEGPTSVAERECPGTTPSGCWRGLACRLHCCGPRVTLAAGKHLPLPRLRARRSRRLLVRRVLGGGGDPCPGEPGVHRGCRGQPVANRPPGDPGVDGGGGRGGPAGCRARADRIAAGAIGRAAGGAVSGGVVARTIDELPLVAVAATQAEGVTTIRDAAELRVKESDRLAVLAAGLRELGADVEEAPDRPLGAGADAAARGGGGIRRGPPDGDGVRRGRDDGVRAGHVGGWEGTAISYPGFLDDPPGSPGSPRERRGQGDHHRPGRPGRARGSPPWPGPWPNGCRCPTIDTGAMYRAVYPEGDRAGGGCPRR